MHSQILGGREMPVAKQPFCGGVRCAETGGGVRCAETGGAHDGDGEGGEPEAEAGAPPLAAYISPGA